MTRAVTAFQATDGSLFHTADEAREQDAKLLREKKVNKVFHLMGGYLTLGSEQAAYRVIDNWVKLKRIMEGDDASR